MARALRWLFPLASLIAGANVWILAASAGGGRIRDLRVIRLVRRVADQLDWNLLAGAPAWIHTERRVAVATDCAILFAAAAIVALAILFPLAMAGRRRFGPALMAMAAIGLAASGRGAGR